jgi:hypothetical protein
MESTALRTSRLNEVLNLSFYRLLAFLVAVTCFLTLVDGAIPQFELFLLGRVVIGGALAKGVLLAATAFGFLIHPTLRLSNLPFVTWLLCIAYLLAEIPYLHYMCGMSFGDALVSYNGYYSLLLIAPVLVMFHDTVPERVIIEGAILLFLVCAAIGFAQYITARPILFTESADGAFQVNSWGFFDQVRAFSLFTSAMDFGMFCALSGALGIALTRAYPISGTLLFIISAMACFTTLTRLSYLVFMCVCFYAAVLIFGKNPKRGRWQPLLYFGLGISTILVGLSPLISGDASNLQDPGSLIMRIGQWAFYADLLTHSSLAQLLFGVGIVQNDKILPLFPMVIDNVPLALVLHIGIIGLALFGTLLVKMWLYLRSEALVTRQPFVIAAASVWAALACAGIFNIVFSSFGAIFTLVILCEKRTVKNEFHGYPAR